MLNFECLMLNYTESIIKTFSTNNNISLYFFYVSFEESSTIPVRRLILPSAE